MMSPAGRAVEAGVERGVVFLPARTASTLDLDVGIGNLLNAGMIVAVPDVGVVVAEFFIFVA